MIRLFPSNQMAAISRVRTNETRGMFPMQRIFTPLDSSTSLRVSAIVNYSVSIIYEHTFTPYDRLLA